MIVGLEAAAQSALSGLFLIGAASILADARRAAARATENRDGVFLLVVFVLPPVAYAFIGACTPRFGHARNFFYLLPIYALISARGISAAVRGPRSRAALLGAIAASLVLSAFARERSELSLSRRDEAALELAARLPSDLVLVGTSQRAWPFKVAAARLSLLGKAYPFDCERNETVRDYGSYFSGDLRARLRGNRRAFLIVPRPGGAAPPRTIVAFSRLFRPDENDSMKGLAVYETP